MLGLVPRVRGRLLQLREFWVRVRIAYRATYAARLAEARGDLEVARVLDGIAAAQGAPRAPRSPVPNRNR